MNRKKIRFWVVIASAWLAAGLLSAHEYLEESLLIIHPWSLEAEQGASGVLMGLKITDISAADALIGAETPIAGKARLVAANGDPIPESGVEMPVGEEIVLQQGGPHFLLDDIKMTLHWGREYPLTLYFREAGVVEASFVVGDD